AGITAHAEVRVQNDPVDAIVTADQQILVESAQPIHHGGQVRGSPPSVSNCPAGATFSQPRLRNSVGGYSLISRDPQRRHLIHGRRSSTFSVSSIKNWWRQEGGRSNRIIQKRSAKLPSSPSGSPIGLTPRPCRPAPPNPTAAADLGRRDMRGD